MAAVVLGSPAAHAQEPGVRREGNLVYFNLQNVDIRSALESLSEVLGISYVLGGSVPTGTPITINTSAGIPIEKVPDLLDSVLRTYNLTLLKTGDVFTVIQAQEGVAGQPQAPAQTQVYVYYLRNANAVDLANVLTQLFQGGAPAGGFQRRTQPSQALSQRLEQQQLDYQAATEDQLPNNQLQIQQQQQPGAVTRIIPGELVGQTAIVPDETTNSLIIKTAPENYVSIQETIGKLDVRPLQVLIEVTIAEITLDKSSQFGFEYFLRRKDIIGGDVTRSEAELKNTTPFDNGLRSRVFDSANVDATFRALAADARVNVLSTPRILAINNHEARILVGSEVPFVQFQRSTIGDAVDRVVQFRNVGLELTVTPRINPDRYVSMDLLQQVSSLSSDVLFDAPIITTREAQTTLVVADKQTVVLGGLMEDRKEKRRNGIPLLKDIPILGILFGSSSNRNVKTELVITLTPYIVGSDEEMQKLRQGVENQTEFYKEELNERRKEGRPVPGGLAPNGGAVSDGIRPALAPDTLTVRPPALGLPADTLEGPPASAAPGAVPPAAATPGAVPPTVVSPSDSIVQVPYVPPARGLPPPAAGATAPPSGTPAPPDTGELKPGRMSRPTEPKEAVPEVRVSLSGEEEKTAPMGAALQGPPRSGRVPKAEPSSLERALLGASPTPGRALAEGRAEPGPSGNADAPADFLDRASKPSAPAIGAGIPAGTTVGPGGLLRQGANPDAASRHAPAAGAAPAAGSMESLESGWRIQVKAVTDSAEADLEASRMRQILGDELPVYVEFLAPWYKVRVGDFATQADARQALERLRALGTGDAWPVRTSVRRRAPG